MNLILWILLIVVLIGGLPNFGVHHYGYYPSGMAGIILIVLLVLVLTGRL